MMGGTVEHAKTASFVARVYTVVATILTPLDSTPAYAKSECALSTSACVVAVLAGLYAPGLPHPHVDPAFISNVMKLTTLATIVKLGCFVLYVFPTTHGQPASVYNREADGGRAAAPLAALRDMRLGGRTALQ
jgi:hypothetical protein